MCFLEKVLGSVESLFTLLGVLSQGPQPQRRVSCRKGIFNCGRLLQVLTGGANPSPSSNCQCVQNANATHLSDV